MQQMRIRHITRRLVTVFGCDYGIAIDASDAMYEHGTALTETYEAGTYDGVTLAMVFRERGAFALRHLACETHMLCDLKSVLGVQDCDVRL